MILQNFDPEVEWCTPQPLKMAYRGLDGEPHEHTPDVFVEWRTDIKVRDARPLLVDVKYREAIHGAWREWRHLYRVMTNYAEDRGWRYKLLSEREIRTPRLKNANFLLPYLKRTSLPDVEQRILEALKGVGETDPKTLMASLHPDKWEQAAMVPMLWKLMAERRIGFDEDTQLTMLARIWTLHRRRK